ncbi:hypothetical protein NGB36_02315 [Streptomyces sp. RB6PN25]|uniref:Nucleic acid/nucleotide deaminase of polymorphic system toxin n=1 Tax=Streptomyces humicola TaxID=2953240 RepID=A0ABT1PQP4_9ACTN|nr:nucleic acid/nucleotide deaminase domain-containing protein [Streptomyces humicola]MCQ4079463.1 hypothetical protein [Streptomyces humicola]
MGGIEEKIARPVVRTLEKFSEKIPKGMAQRFHDLGQATRKAADHFDKAEGEIAGRVPVYKVEADGTVMKLVGGKFHPLHDVETEADKGSGIKEILGEDGKASTWEKGKYTLDAEPNEKVPGDLGPKVRNPVDSTKVDPGSTPLSMATAQARRADGEAAYGRNYVAFHYRDEGSGHNFILVGRSIPYKAHSEQYAGIPFLEKGIGGNVKAVYTERAPCDFGRNCQSWLGRYFNNGQPEVSHSFNYAKDKDVREHGELSSYLLGLFDQPLPSS